MMKPLLNKDNIKHIKLSDNKFGLTKKDLICELKGFPLGVVVRMLEEQERQGNKPNIKVFLQNPHSDKREGGFTWDRTKDGFEFWANIDDGNYEEFYEKYPEYRKYDE